MQYLMPLHLKISFMFAEIESNSTITAHSAGVIEGLLQKRVIEKLPKSLRAYYAKNPLKKGMMNSPKMNSSSCEGTEKIFLSMLKNFWELPLEK